MLVTCDIDDEILIPEPFYTSYNGLASMTNVNIVPVFTQTQDGFRLPNIDEVVKLITPRTRAILMSNLRNTTGRVYTKEEVYMLAEVAKKHSLYIFADRVYREFIYGNANFISFTHLKDIEDRVVLIDSISNLNNVPRSYIEEARIEYEARRDIVFNALREMEGVVCEKPQGAFYFLVKLPMDNAEYFVVRLLNDFHVNEETVMLAPAENFYSTQGLGKDEVRISYCIDQESLKKAMNILGQGLKEYPGRI